VIARRVRDARTRFVCTATASSGFGAATARELGRRGMGIIGVHLDRKVTLPQAEAVAEDVRAAGSPAHFFNVNAADDEKRAAALAELGARFDAQRAAGKDPFVKVVMHSLAFGANLQSRFATLRIFIRWRVHPYLPRETALVYMRYC